MKKILIYKGAGACPQSVSSLVSSFQQEGLGNHYQIIPVDKSIFSDERWQEEASLLAFPGGRDIPYHQALRGAPNQSIHQFVSNGGLFLGLCAGAYYGSAVIEFESGGPLEVVAHRELKFFPGTAFGPAYGPGKFCYRSRRGAKMASLSVSGVEELLDVYYNGGCAFRSPEQYSDVSVLARYADIEGKPTAVVKCRVGNGLAVLCGVHPEYSAEHEQIKEAMEEPLLLALKAAEEKRRRLFQELLQALSL